MSDKNVVKFPTRHIENVRISEKVMTDLLTQIYIEKPSMIENKNFHDLSMILSLIVAALDRSDGKYHPLHEFTDKVFDNSEIE